VVSTAPASPSQNRRDECVLPSSFSPVFRVTRRDRAVQSNSDRVQPSIVNKEMPCARNRDESMRVQLSRRVRVDILDTGMDGEAHRIADVICSRMIRALSHVIHNGERPHARQEPACASLALSAFYAGQKTDFTTDQYFHPSQLSLLSSRKKLHVGSLFVEEWLCVYERPVSGDRTRLSVSPDRTCRLYRAGQLDDTIDPSRVAAPYTDAL
jgi:hypothetical protein